MPNTYFTDDVITNEQGGKQSDTPCRLDLIPAVALLEVGKVLKQGADKYGENNWQLIPRDEHINHALTHLYGFLSGDRSERHLVNAACRVLFAIWSDVNNNVSDVGEIEF